jgi:cytochrome c553
VTPSGASPAELQSRAQEILRQSENAQKMTPTVPLTKAQKLAELNALYKADQVTPAEYHKRRAAILAEP